MSDNKTDITVYYRDIGNLENVSVKLARSLKDRYDWQRIVQHGDFPKYRDRGFGAVLKWVKHTFPEKGVQYVDRKGNDPDAMPMKHENE